MLVSKDKYGFIFFYATIVYAIWYALDKDSPNNGATRYVWMRQKMTNWTEPILSYFPLTVHFTTKLSSQDKYIFGYHPHGILPFGAMTLTPQKEKFFVQMGSLSLHFKIPLWREIAMLFGFVDVSRHACEAALSINGSIMITVGGAREAMDAFAPDQMLLTIRNGFFKLAMKTGTPVVPVLAIGELGLFVPIRMKQGKWFKYVQTIAYHRLGLGLSLFRCGRMGLLPTKQPIDVYVGEPIKVPHTSHPSAQELATVREAYIKQLHAMFNEFNKDPRLKLRIKS